MKLFRLIEILEGYPQNLDVAYQCFSEYCLLEEDDPFVADLGLPRPDGWVASERPDKPTTPYLVFPGN